MVHRNMGSPLLSSTEPPAEELELEVTPAPFTDFEFDLQSNRLRCAGYSVAEVSELLELYRNHMRLMHEFATAANALMQEAHA